MPLRPCSSCARHVRATETTCPFCTSALTACADTSEPTTTARLSRAAIVLAGAAALAGCGKESGIAPVYGGPPPVQLGADGGRPDNTGLAPAYGGPPEVYPAPTPASTDAGAPKRDAGR